MHQSRSHTTRPLINLIRTLSVYQHKLRFISRLSRTLHSLVWMRRDKSLSDIYQQSRCSYPTDVHTDEHLIILPIIHNSSINLCRGDNYSSFLIPPIYQIFWATSQSTACLRFNHRSGHLADPISTGRCVASPRYNTKRVWVFDWSILVNFSLYQSISLSVLCMRNRHDNSYLLLAIQETKNNPSSQLQSTTKVHVVSSELSSCCSSVSVRL